MKDAQIVLNQVDYLYQGSYPALNKINLSVKSGELLAIIGTNGCGKSTLMHLLNGLIFPDSGSYQFEGRNINQSVLKQSSYNHYFRSSMGYVFQNTDAQLFCSSVYDEIMFGVLQLGLSDQECRDRTDSMMEMLNITHLKKRPPYMLSGGEKKRTAIASVLAVNPSVLLFDEPMNGLDPKTQSFITELILKLNQAGKTIILSIHDLELVSYLQPKVAVMIEDHSINRIGSALSILNDIEYLKEVNLIHEHVHRHGNQIHSHLNYPSFTHKH